MRTAMWKFLAWSLVIVPATLRGAIINVPGDFSDLKLALSASGKCDTILLDSGYYSDAGFRNITLADTNCVTIMSKYGADKTVIDLADSTFVSKKGQEFPIGVLSLQGLHFIHGHPAFECGENPTTISIRACTFSECRVGILTNSWGNYGPLMPENCSFRNNDTAIYCPHGSITWVSYSLFADNSYGLISGGSGEDVVLYHCTLLRQKEVAFQFVPPSFEMRTAAYNSVFADNECAVRQIGGGVWALQEFCLHCDFYNNRSGNLCDSGGPVNWDPSNIFSDPLLCSTDPGSISLGSASPLLPSNNASHQLIGHTDAVGCYCGDVDVSGGIDISDIAALISYSFLGGPPPTPLVAGEIDGVPGLDISDVSWLIGYLFLGGPRPICLAP